MKTKTSMTEGEPAVRVVATPESCSVSLVVPGGFRAAAVAEASLMPWINDGDHDPTPRSWYVNRVLVTSPDSRGSGLGTQVLEALKDAVRSQGGREMIVEPGGYGADPDKQKNFYVKNGFKPYRDENGDAYVCKL